MTTTQTVGESVLSAASATEVRMGLVAWIRRKWVGFLFGVATQLLFLWTAYQLFLFLRFGGASLARFHPASDLGWAFLFAWPHSLLLYPPVTRHMKTYIPGGLHGCIHCCATCISLLLLISNWSVSEAVIWDLKGPAERLMLCAFYGAWIGLFYSLYLTGLGYQTGLLPWYWWLRDMKPSVRKFEIKGAFRWMRHPVYLSFLGLIWFTPRMTMDHAILTLVWTLYVYVGSYLKDRRLAMFIGQPYREYAARVTGFPLIGFGPWGKTTSLN